MLDLKMKKEVPELRDVGGLYVEGRENKYIDSPFDTAESNKPLPTP